MSEARVGDIAVDRGWSLKCSRFVLGQVHDVKQELEDFKSGMALTVNKHQHKVIRTD